MELNAKQVKSLPTAALKIIQRDLRWKIVPDAMKQTRALQRSLVWVDRELKSRAKGESNEKVG